jgi:hypothetical protein
MKRSASSTLHINRLKAPCVSREQDLQVNNLITLLTDVQRKDLTVHGTPEAKGTPNERLYTSV